MRVAVVVTMRNEAHTIASLLDALVAQTRAADEIVLADGGSTDGTKAAVEGYAGQLPRLRLLDAPGSNIAQGRNRGIAAAESLIIAVTDAGCVPDREWLARISEPLERDPEVGLVSGVVLPRAANHLEACIGRCSLASVSRIGFYPTARALAFRRDVWVRVGGFPEYLDFGEDAAFIVAVAAAGSRLEVSPQAVVRWRPRGNYREVMRQFYHYADGLGQAGLSRSFHLNTVVQSAGGVACAALGLVFHSWLAWAFVLLLAGSYLLRKARQGCFDIPSWRTYYRVPLVLLAIHVGTMAGIVHGNWRRLVWIWRR